MSFDPYLLGLSGQATDECVEIRRAPSDSVPRLRRLRLDPEATPLGTPWPAWIDPALPMATWAAPASSGSPPGRPLAWFGGAAGELPAITEVDGRLIFNFDPVATVAHVTGERYVHPRRPLHTYAPWLVSALPGRVRLAGHHVASRVEGFRHRLGGKPGNAPGEQAFPDYPRERSVELIRLLFHRALGLEGRSFWPAGASAVAMITCDVDTADGQDRMPAIAQEAERLGLTACFYVVGDRFPLDHGLLRRVRQAGHEIGLHGAKHDMRLAYLPYPAVMERLDRCREMVEQHQVVGFRSPALLTSPALTRALSGRFSYDSSVPDTDVDTVAAPRRGCGSLFPFWQGSLLQIPLTLPLDDRLLLRGESPGQMVTTWQRKMHWIRKAGGAAVLTTHAEPHLGGSPKLLPSYRRMLEWIVEQAWPVILPRQAATHLSR